MLLSQPIRFGVPCLSLALLVAAGSAAPPGGVQPSGTPQPFYLPPPITGPRTFAGPAVGYSSPLYSPYGYGLDYSPFAYRHLNPTVVGYGPPHPGYGPRSPYSLSYPGSLGALAVPGPYPASRALPYRTLPPLREVAPRVEPRPFADAGAGKPGAITVIAGEGAAVSFDGTEVKGSGGRFSFTTKPIPPGAELRVRVKVDGPGGASTISVGLRAGERATVDLRK